MAKNANRGVPESAVAAASAFLSGALAAFASRYKHWWWP